VGKTTISAATAIECARRGHRTLVLSADSAHSLSDSFDALPFDELTPIADNLFAQEIKVYRELERYWSEIQEYVVRFLVSQGYEEVMAQELAIVPGLEEFFSLLKVKEYADSGEFDVVIIDCAPTGSTLRLLGFTDIFRWYMERFFKLERKLARVVKPVAERIIKAPLPEDGVYDAVERIYHQLMGLAELLSDPEITSVRIVTAPEKMVIRESQRAYAALMLFGYPVDLVIVNRVFPEEALRDYFKEVAGQQKRAAGEVRVIFGDLPIKEVRQFASERVGTERLSELAGELFGGEDPAKVNLTRKPIEISAREGGCLISFAVPGAKKEDISLWAKDGELIIAVADQRRNYLLPDALRDYDVVRAKLEGDRFKVWMEPK